MAQILLTFKYHGSEKEGAAHEVVFVDGGGRAVQHLRQPDLQPLHLILQFKPRNFRLPVEQALSQYALTWLHRALGGDHRCTIH